MKNINSAPRGAFFCAATTSFFLMYNFVVAQAQPDAGSLQKEIERDRSAIPAPIPPIDKGARPAETGGPKVTVNRFVFAGNTLLSDDQLQEVVSPWQTKPLSLDELKWVTNKISEAYRELGYLARVVLPQQNIQRGEIQVVIVEAKFGKISARKTDPEQRVQVDFVEKTFYARQRENDFLKIADVERAALILNETPGIKIKPVLTAGEAVGLTNIGVEASDEPMLSGLVSVDNYGARSTGRARLMPVLKITNPSGIGDEVQLISLLSEGNIYARARYSRPVGYDGWRAGVAASFLTYELGEEFEVLEAEGAAATLAVDASYPIIREKNRNLRAVTMLAHKQYDNEQFGESISEKTLNVLSAGISGDLLDNLYGGGISFYGAELSYGDLDLSDNLINQTQDQLGPETEGSYGKLTFNLARLQKLFATTNLWFSLNGQLSSKNLDSSETFSLGGIGGVRAYPVLEASGDNGWIFTAEIRHNLKSNLIITPFIDYGQAIERSTQLQSCDTHDLKGIGVGVDWTYADDIAVRAAVARRIGKNPLADPTTGDDSDGSHIEWPVWISVAKYF